MGENQTLHAKFPLARLQAIRCTLAAVVLALSVMVSPARAASLFEELPPLGEWLKVNGMLSTRSGHIVNNLKRVQEKILPGQKDKSSTSRCSVERLSGIFRDRSLSPQEMSERLENYFVACLKRGSLLSSAKAGAVIELEQGQYVIEDNPQIREVTITLPNGIKRKALLGLQTSHKPLPLVVVVTGFGSNSTGFLSRNALEHVFSSSAFHVLVLDSMSGSDYLKLNSEISFGGFDEGRQVHNIFHLIAGSPLSRFISSYHLAGISLGGHSALYGAYYLQSDPEGSRLPLRSVIAMCPVVNLQETIEALQRDDSVGKKYRDSVFNQVKTGAARLRVSSNVEKPSVYEIRSFLDKTLSLDFMERFRNPEMFVGPFAKSQISSMGDFWKLNQFENYAAQLKIPTLVWYSVNDPVAAPKVNGQRLKKYPNFSVVSVDHGSHCGFDLFYGVSAVKTLLQRYMFMHTPELQDFKLATITEEHD